MDLAAVQELLAEGCILEPEEITPEKHLASDLELDSFGLMDMILTFEKAFSITIPDRDLRQLDTVQDVVDYLSRRVEE